MPIFVALYLLIRGTYTLIKALALRAGVRSQDTAFFLGFYLTPLVLVGAFFGLNFLIRALQRA